MADDPYSLGRWADSLEELDSEIAHLATLCQVKLLEPGMVARVLRKDASVCGTDNPHAFARLHDLIMVHLALWEKSADALGAARTSAIEDFIVARVAKRFPDLGNWRSE